MIVAMKYFTFLIIKRGVELMMYKQVGLWVKINFQYSETLIMMKLETFRRHTITVRVYMPTGTHDDDEIEKIYEDIDKMLKCVKGDENLIILGEWNARIV
jgi:hypothetical protein